MRRIAAKFVPHLMTSDQQAHRVQVCQDLLDHSENDKEFLSKIITGDESWVYGYDNGSIFTVDEQNNPQTQKSSPSSIQNQGAAHSFFLMLMELSTTSTFLKAPQRTRPTTLKF